MKKVLFLALLWTGILFCSCRAVVTERPVQPVYVRPSAPGTEYIWIDGDWRARHRRYEWREGYWSRPRSGREWRSGTWQSHSNGYYWNKGRWNRPRKH